MRQHKINLPEETWIDKIRLFKIIFYEWFYSLRTVSKIREKYWRLVPYEYRLGELYYKLKCLLWSKHTTIKSRYLPHTWVDRDMVLAYTMIEILQRFLEEEKDNVEWYYEGAHKTTINGHEWYVIDVYEHISNWFTQVYEVKYNALGNGTGCFMKRFKKGENLNNQLKEYLKILIDCKDSMWT